MDAVNLHKADAMRPAYDSVRSTTRTVNFLSKTPLQN